MPKFNTTRRVQHAATDMFDLVADVERYPDFVPLCGSLAIRKRAPGPDDTEVLTADMTVAYKLVRESFTSRVTLDRPKLRILVEYLEGPFSFLENRWVFRATGDRSCEIDFFISYEFKSRMLGMLMGSMFDLAFRRLTTAFEKRADEIYKS
jgi:coenzyme Q-binding protein COQ10